MAHCFEIVGDWVIHQGERGVAPMLRLAAALGGGELVRQPGRPGARTWSAGWTSTEGAALGLYVAPYGATDAQEYRYELRLSDGTTVRYLLIDTCSMSCLEFTVEPGGLSPQRVEAETRLAFEAF
ncbi:MAG: hypothetical protein H6719_00230 [Sandaracinaceae bacterium]|nr:hypothetical protein [Sandaracinaceae bacterium]